MRVVLEFEQVTGGIFEEKRVMLDASSRETDARLLIERQSLGLRPVRQSLPRLLREEHQPEMARVDAFLLARNVLHHMGHQLMVAQPERHGAARFAPERAAKPVHIESLGHLDIVNW